MVLVAVLVSGSMTSHADAGEKGVFHDKCTWKLLRRTQIRLPSLDFIEGTMVELQTQEFC